MLAIDDADTDADADGEARCSVFASHRVNCIQSETYTQTSCEYNRGTTWV